MTTLLDARPGGFDVIFRHTDALNRSLVWPAGSLVGRTFTATVDAQAVTVGIVGDVMTLSLTVGQTTTLGEGTHAFALTETTAGGSNEVLVGTWVGSLGPAAVPSASPTLTLVEGQATVSVGDAGHVAQSLADGAHGGQNVTVPMSYRVSAMAMRAGAGTPTLVTTANGLPGWSLDFTESVVCSLPQIPAEWLTEVAQDVFTAPVEIEVIYSIGSGASGNVLLTGKLGRVDIGAVMAAGTATAAHLVAVFGSAGTPQTMTLRYMPDASTVRADPRETTALELTLTNSFGTGPLVIHELLVRDGRFNRLQLGTDLIGTWWTRPRSTANAAGKVFVAGIRNAFGQTSVGVADIAAVPPAQYAHVNLGTVQEDDHNNPALVVPAAATGRVPLVFYAGHNLDTLLRYRRGTTPEDVSNLGTQPELTINMGAGETTTYAEAHARPTVGSGEVHVFTRGTGWNYVRSTDHAVSWSAPRQVLYLGGQPYLASAMLADGRTLRCAAFLHPSLVVRQAAQGTFPGIQHHIWAWQVDLQTGDVTKIGSTQVIANVQTGLGLPLTPANLDPVYSCPAGRTTHTFDVSSGSTPLIVFAEKDENDTATANSVYKLLRHKNNKWETRTLKATGHHFGHVFGFYVGGGAFPQFSDATLYLSREANELWSVEKLVTANAWDSWTTEVVDQLDQPLVRPFAVDGTTSSIEVTYYRLQRFDGFGADQFQADLYAT